MLLHTQLPIHFLTTFLPKFPPFPTIQTHPFSIHSSLLGLCTNTRHLLQVHARFILHGFTQNPTLSSKLIDRYANLGNLGLARKLFDNIPNPDSTLYGSIIRNLCTFGDRKNSDALLMYSEMVMKFMYPNEIIYPSVIKCCSCLSDVKSGMKIHGHVMKMGFDSFDMVASALVEMYRIFGGSENDEDIMEGMCADDINYWNSLIYEASQNGNAEESFQIFKKMRMEGVQSDLITIINLLRASVDRKSLRAGKSVHCLVVVSNMCGEMDVDTALLTMYSKLGCLKNATLLFERMHEKDRVVWNIMISAYSQNGCPGESLKLLKCMVRSGVTTDFFTAMAAISSISEMKSIEFGKQMHAYVARTGSDYQVSVHNSLIDMYCKCDHTVYARNIFDLVSSKTVISWSSMIKGYVKVDQCYEAFSLFIEMKLDGIRVDSITLINVLPACVNIGALEQLKYLHGVSIKHGLNSILSVNSAFLISYAKCGCIEIARKLFDEEKIDGKDIIIWNSMISAYSKHGNSLQCFEMYKKMKQSKSKPDKLTFLALLTACVNSGFVKKGWAFFKEMTENYRCQANQEHYACMVDLLARAGNIQEAKDLINTMPFEPDARVWGPLLSACKLHSETELAEFAAEKLITMEPKNAGNYILLSNIYAAAGKWEGVAKMRSFLRDNGLKKVPGCSWLDINGKVHEFRVADRSHPKSDGIYAVLRNIEFDITDERLKEFKRQTSFQMDSN